MDDSAAQLRELLDRQQILDCVHRYCHGMDRLDRAMVLSAYHPDAYDDHGYICAPAAEFVDFTIARHAEFLSETHHHLVTNHRAEIEGDTAHAVTYFLYSITAKPSTASEGQPKVSLHGGRYIDRFERRDGKWAIADRVAIVEWSGALGDLERPVTAGTGNRSGHAARDRTDLSYNRPLRVDRGT